MFAGVQAKPLSRTSKCIQSINGKILTDQNYAFHSIQLEHQKIENRKTSYWNRFLARNMSGGVFVIITRVMQIVFHAYQLYRLLPLFRSPKFPICILTESLRMNEVKDGKARTPVKDLKWRTLRLLAVNHCCKALHLRCLRRYWV